jgi:hypothetical protein
MASGSPAGDERLEAHPTRRSIVLRIALLIAIVGFVFVGILPRVVDYDAVRAAPASLTPGQLGALIGVTVIAHVLNAGPARMLVPDSSGRARGATCLKRGDRSRLVRSTGIGRDSRLKPERGALALRPPLGGTAPRPGSPRDEDVTVSESSTF